MRRDRKALGASLNVLSNVVTPRYNRSPEKAQTIPTKISLACAVINYPKELLKVLTFPYIHSYKILQGGR